MRNFRQDFYLTKICFDIVERGRRFLPWFLVTNDTIMRAASFASGESVCSCCLFPT